MSGFVLRAAEEGDLNFIRKTWITEYMSSHWARTMGKPNYIAEQWKVRDRLLSRGTLLIAGRESEPTSIAGWVCTEGQKVHFIYVKERWRKLGVARMLLAPLLTAPVVCTHRTDLCAELPVPKQWTFNQYAAFL